jgi:hypothetical protein
MLLFLSKSSIIWFSVYMVAVLSSVCMFSVYSSAFNLTRCSAWLLVHPLFNPLPALTYQNVLDLNVARRAKRTQTYWLSSL